MSSIADVSNTEDMLRLEDAPLQISWVPASSTTRERFLGIIRDRHGDMVEGEGETIEEMLVNLEEACAEWLDEWY